MAMLAETRSRKRAWYLIAFVVTIVAGLASRRFSQVLPALLGKYPGDALWSLMVFFGLGIIFKQLSSLRLGFAALGFSFGIETLKLWQAPWLVSIRQTTLGHLVFGHVFSWQNLVTYTVGILAGLLVEVLFVRCLRVAGNHNAV
ncbi:MAG: ribosomal maturation YjgA family protein [Limisphaerales bacterium]